MSKVNVLGVKIDNLTIPESEDQLSAFLLQKKPAIICTPNTEIVVLANRDKGFLDILNQESSLNLPDSIGVLWAAKFNSFKNPENRFLSGIVIVLQWFFSILLIPFAPNFYNTIPEKISGSDFVYKIVEFAVKNRLKLFLLGGGPTIAEQAALKLQTETPGLRIGGVYSGSSKDNEKIIEAINKSRADILLVAFGAPKQEKWLSLNLQKTSCKIGIGLGGTFDFVSGRKKRAPMWMRRLQLEWLFRLIIEPRRIWRQTAIPKFLWMVLANRLKK
jgi:N-acetylglucosaminyldiphosphoundecaprenol N-acetyl-beta-D-mannosaminyltransferase